MSAAYFLDAGGWRYKPWRACAAVDISARGDSLVYWAAIALLLVYAVMALAWAVVIVRVHISRERRSNV